MSKEKKNPKSIADEPGYWFAKLERADAEADYEDAAEAKRNLDRLGWIVNRKQEVRA